MSCNCNPADIRKKYAGMFFTSVSKPEKAAEKELKKKAAKKKAEE